MAPTNSTFGLRLRRIVPTLRYAIFGHLLIWLSSCYYIPKATGPLRTIEHRWTPDTQQKRLLVFLPGRGDSADSFTEQGLWKIVQENGSPFDAIAVDAHLGYYLNRSIAERVQSQIIDPARAAGYEEIWVVGNSMGSLGALLTEKFNPGTWDRLLLLAPFLGDDKSLYREIEESGGLARWDPQGEFGKTDFSPRLWLWLRDWHELEKEAPKLRLGFGKSDRFHHGIRLLEKQLPATHVHAIEGGHKWPIWRDLFRKTLADATTTKAQISSPTHP